MLHRWDALDFFFSRNCFRISFKNYNLQCFRIFLNGFLTNPMEFTLQHSVRKFSYLFFKGFRPKFFKEFHQKMLQDIIQSFCLTKILTRNSSLKFSQGPMSSCSNLIYQGILKNLHKLHCIENLLQKYLTNYFEHFLKFVENSIHISMEKCLEKLLKEYSNM